MLLRHGALYSVGKGLPGLVNFISLAVFTRLLSPEEFGEYTLVVTAVGTADALLLQWLRLALLRFLPRSGVEPGMTLATIIRVLLAILGAASLVALAVTAFFVTDPTVRHLMYLGIALFLVQGVFEVTIERERADLSPARYGLYAGGKAVLALAIGTGLALLGWGAASLLVGLIAAMAVTLTLLGAPAAWGRALKGAFEPGLAREVAVYGLPLATTAGLGFILNTSDRFMLAGFLDSSAAGSYAVGYDLANYGIGMLLSIVNLASYPLVVSALERRGADAARVELGKTLGFLLMVGLPAAAGMAALAPNIAGVLMGQEFEASTAVILPWIAAVALIAGVKSFYLDVAFQLGRDTIKQLWIMLATVILNVVLNVWWIPTMGLQGAIYSTVVAYSVAAVLAWWLGRFSFQLPPFPARMVGSICLATLAMLLALWGIREWSGGLALAVQVTGGALVYLLVLVALNRKLVAALVRSRGAVS